MNMPLQFYGSGTFLQGKMGKYCQVMMCQADRLLSKRLSTETNKSKMCFNKVCTLTQPRECTSPP